jgi:hypothetical protein
LKVKRLMITTILPFSPYSLVFPCRMPGPCIVRIVVAANEISWWGICRRNRWV